MVVCKTVIQFFFLTISLRLALGCDNSTYYECSNGDCIPKKWVCDGEADCRDEGDEKNCQKQVDCIWGSWGSWSECSKQCGAGQRTKTRRVIVIAQNGGRPCTGYMNRHTSCNLRNCPEFPSNEDGGKTGKIVHLDENLIPQNMQYLQSQQAKPAINIISDFIKSSETKFAVDRRHVKSTLPFDGTTDLTVKGAGDFGFFTAIYECYNNHWALRTIPDDWWYTIIRTVAIAIDKKSKEDNVRKFFVNHEGKKRLVVDVKSSGIDYARFFRKMTNLVQSNIKLNGYVDAIRANFSTSTPTHRIVSEITVMASMQEFFEYVMNTLCGIPYVEMLGKEEDWVQLKRNVLKLKNMLKPIESTIELGDWWPRVETICDKLIETFKGNADDQWWRNIFVKQQHGFGSGSHVTYDGWFLRDLLNNNRVETLKNLPSGLVSVPLIFSHNGVDTGKGAIVSGIAGIKIDSSKDIPTVQSTHGWAIFR